MKTRLIHHVPGNRRLILLFTGWSTTPEFYTGLHADGWDIMTVYDYTSSELDPSILTGYTTVFILAWSLGVAAVELAATAGAIDTGRITAAFAVNGTTYPAHDTMGIPVGIYDGTEAGLSPRTLERFRRRMSSARDPYPLPGEASSSLEGEVNMEETILRLRKELRRLHDGGKVSWLPWRRAYISKSDLIFPAANQRTAWEQDIHAPQIVEIEAGHY
ncbi:MAG: DUF452 family protein, partial [Muribaculaceae bacterium]|nr:DUF452 family protein [Muribaculaceae bacterium]